MQANASQMHTRQNFNISNKVNCQWMIISSNYILSIQISKQWEKMSKRVESITTMNIQPVRPSFAALRPLLLSEESRVNQTSKNVSPYSTLLLYSSTTNKALATSYRNYSNNNGNKFKGKFTENKQNIINLWYQPDKSPGILGQSPSMPPPLKQSAKCQIYGMYNHEALDCHDRFNHAYASNKLHKSSAAMHIDEASNCWR
ncbi:hypothetical protein LIER_24853 [Lithospermum erythrorhizon]|uniref:Uncharacterized protein n=1 Tax=Lithospermum erythrorhizon TaxID=34254 RepID=A0AAV3R6B2_LITER